ncbi:hypothetical protein FSP39_000975 [Pinctada imbricata]|uniref:Spt20-like SEP domain-containing protein n=1 Tax=Pinctada imbricata TaxID=66713 RepID=A0AA88YGY4_PINIB|nr:hypothetical protein FSP39_000975 [Pinctada imbricata]
MDQLSREVEYAEGIRYATNLLSKLVRRDKLNCLILKLYPGNEGYSLMLRGRNGVESETLRLPYEVSELLEYVDASQLPPFLVDLLEKAQVNVFYSGCVIVEVRDYRRSTNGDFDAQHVLLKPTPQSLLSDIYNLTNDGHRWTQEDQNLLESQLLLATEEPLCLDPSPAVLLVANKLQYEQKNLNTPLIKRAVKKYSQAAVNRKRKFAHSAAPKELKLYDFIHKKKTRATQPYCLKVGKPHIDMWKQRSVHLAAPESVDVGKYATVKELPKDVKEHTFDIVEEITLERDVTPEKKILAKLRVKRSTPDDVYHGELYLDHDYKEDSQGSSCRYLRQFKEIFTEEGRKAVKITTQKPGQPPHIEFTQTNVSATTPGLNISGASALLSGHASTLSAAIRGQVNQADQSNTSGQSMKRNVPIQLSLTLAPAAPGATTQGSNQLQLNLQKQGVVTQPQGVAQGMGQRSKSSTQGMPAAQGVVTPQGMPSQQGITTAQGLPTPQRPSSTPTASPVVTPTTNISHSQIFSPVMSTSMTIDNTKPPLQTPVNPGSSVTMTTRKHSTDGSTMQHLQHGIPQGNIALVQTSDANQSQISQQPGITNINIANIASLPPYINIQNLANIPGMNITNLPALQNMQVSLTGVSMPGGGIAVPVPITLINTNSGVIQNQGIFVTSLSGISTTSTASSIASTNASSSTAVAGASGSGASNSNTGVTAPSLVTMVTALPTASTATPVSQLVATSGSISTSTVLAAPGGVLSPIIGLAPFMSTNIKPQGGAGVRPLLQIHGQQGIQLLGLQQPRAPLKPGTATLQAGQLHPVSKTAPSISTTAVQLTATNLGGQQMATLSQIKPGPSPGGALPQQILQLQQLPLNKMQQIQLKQAVPGGSPALLQGNMAKQKSKKRTTPTPPK